MVATERMARAQAEQRLKDTEESLAAAESAVRDMQTHLQSLTTAAASAPSAPHVPRRYLSSHPPYAEFRTLLAHLRAARPSQLSRRRSDVREVYPAPLLVSLVQQPFVARCLVEDHEPTLRLESAPDLGWVSRRSVSNAIVSGDLLIEPVGSASLGPPESLSCSLCGRAVFGGSGSANKGLLKFFGTTGTSASSPSQYPSSVYVFRVATDKDTKSYPLCKNGWCLARLRAACALWHFVRTGIVHPVWFGEDSTDTQPPVTPKTASTTGTEPGDDGTPVRIDLNATPPEADKLTVSPAPGPVPGQRSASAPVTGPVAITIENLAAAEYRRPQPVPQQRKSGWGLGSFGLGSGGKSSGAKSSGWTSWGSRPSTPATPATPATPERREYQERSVSAGAAPALGAPIDLGNEKGAEAGLGLGMEEGKAADKAVGENDMAVDDKSKSVEVAIAEEKAAAAEEMAAASQEMKAAVEGKPVEEAAAEGKEGNGAEDKEVKDAEVANPEDKEAKGAEAAARSESRTSHRSQGSTDVGSFNTPLGDNASLPDVNGADAEDKDTVVAAGEVKPPEAVSGENSDEVPTAKGTRSTTPEAEAASAGEVKPADATDEAKPADETAAAPATVPANGSPQPPPRAAGRQPPPPPLPKRSVRRGMGTPTPPITPTDANANANEAKELAASDAVDEAKPAAAEGDSAPASASATETDAAPVTPTVATHPDPAVAPATPTTATHPESTDSGATPTASSSPSHLPPPPPRHPLAVMNSPTTSPRSSIEGRTARPTPPPPPPRHRAADRSFSASSVATTATNRTATSAGTSTAAHTAHTAQSEQSDDGGRAFVTGEGWEARAWRQVVRLKEDMWRARVGVVDDE